MTATTTRAPRIDRTTSTGINIIADFDGCAVINRGDDYIFVAREDIASVIAVLRAIADQAPASP